jgi:anti-anti-sigma factor
MISFYYNDDEGITTLSFKGRMDTLAVAKVTELIQAEPGLQNPEKENNLVFDLKDVDYVASSFIRICLTHAKKEGAGRFSIINCQPFVKKTFKISGLDEILNIS